MYYEILTLFFCDVSYFILQNMFKFKYSPSSRWFYIHSLINGIISYNALSDIYIILTQFDNISNMSWTINTWKAFNYSMAIHIYHLLFFKINKWDFLHHFFMCLICGPLTFYVYNITTSFALFFLTGLPGFIDYFTLFLVKIGRVDTLTQKLNYIYISTWLRSPGCILASSISYIVLMKNDFYPDNKLKMIAIVISLILTFLNGQYYLHITYFDYHSKKPRLFE